MFEWMNEQLRTGKMTFDESTPFLGMTIGHEIDNRPVNYLQKIQGGIEAAAWRGDPKEKAMWEMALNIAERYQYQNIGISTYPVPHARLAPDLIRASLGAFQRASIM